MSEAHGQIAIEVKPTVALIISTYDQPNYLGRILRAVAAQDSPPEEVLLADDGSGEDTRNVFQAWAATQSCRAEHLRQAHDGFRKSRILNQTVARVQAEYLVFLDGDTIPHPRFISDHRRLARPQHSVQGHRVLVRHKSSRSFGLGDFATDRSRAFWKGQLRSWKQAYRWPAAWRRVRRDLVGVRGNNMAVWREHMIKVNGYNEEFVGWGREDSELMLRLLNSGVARLDVRGWALCYHLWHMPASRSNLAAENQLFAAASDGRSACQKGLDQHLAALARPTSQDHAMP
jgi:cellulose synthase/poly-beta-1,6-N-acetylglucosamine synthase-like glycosyltransferase